MYPAFIDKGNTVALACLVDNRSRGYDGDTLFFETAEHFPKFFARNRVYTRSRLIQKKNIRLMDKRATKGKLLLHTTGQGSGTTCTKRFYLSVDITHQIIILLNGSMKNRSEKTQVFFYRQVLIERETSGHIPYPLADSLIIFHRVQSTYRSLTLIGKQQSGKNTEQRRFPRTVRPDDSEKFTRTDGERDALQGLHPAVTLKDVIDSYCKVHDVVE